LNCRLDGVTLCPEMRKPFDVLVEGRFLKTSGEGRTPIELFIAGVRGWEGHWRRFFPAKGDLRREP
jgi:hypothetical protein